MAEVSDSILDTTKKALGLSSDYDAFDIDIILHINSVFSTLQQLGIGPINGFMITDNTTKWSDFLGNDAKINNVKTYMYLRVRLLFDPPANSFTLDALAKQILEQEWRLTVIDKTVDNTPPVVTAAYIWDLTGLSDFPEEALVGDLGIDTISGDLWRKV